MDKLLCMIALGAISTVLFYSAEAQTVHIVGDTDGWRIPSSDPSAYTTWAAGKNFLVGDTLVFTFTENRHDVQEVEKSSYDGCSATNAIGQAIMTSPANITLTSTGEHYYICTFEGHCQDGQKLAINVSGAPDGAIPPATGGSTTPSATPPVAGGNSGATTTRGSSIVVFASLMVTSLSIALTFFY